MNTQTNSTKIEGFQPSRLIEISEPCNESWEAMPGDHRRRFCARCEQHVLNTAAITPVALETMLAAPGPMPCVRVVHYADGSLRTARETSPTPLRRVAAFAASAFVSLSSLAAAAQSPTMGRSAAPHPAILTGEVHGPDGKPAAAGTSVLLVSADAGQVSQRRVTATTDAQGRFTLNALPGRWSLRAENPSGRLFSGTLEANLHAGSQQASQTLQLMQERVTMGAPPPRVVRPESR